MAIPISAPVVLLLAFSAISTFLLPSRASENNILPSQGTLAAGESLTYEDYMLLMKEDCNLILHKGKKADTEIIWESKTTRGNDLHCYLTLESHGRLTIKTRDGASVWNSTNPSTIGDYIAVLRPTGELVVYGPQVWPASGALDFSLPKHGNHNCLVGEMGNNCLIGNYPQVSYLLFSDNSLFSKWGGILPSGEYVIVLGDGLKPVVNAWGQYNSYLALDSFGGITVRNLNLDVVWTSGVRSVKGYYVAAFLSDGKFAVYGPNVWSTTPLPPSPVEANGASIATTFNHKIGQIELEIE